MDKRSQSRILKQNLIVPVSADLAICHVRFYGMNLFVVPQRLPLEGIVVDIVVKNGFIYMPVAIKKTVPQEELLSTMASVFFEPVFRSVQARFNILKRS
jgi:hypothetical protein